jgi:hypothetical protein
MAGDADLGSEDAWEVANMAWAPQGDGHVVQGQGDLGHAVSVLAHQVDDEIFAINADNHLALE